MIPPSDNLMLIGFDREQLQCSQELQSMGSRAKRQGANHRANLSMPGFIEPEISSRVLLQCTMNF